jgi:hypothetical protein
LRDWEIIRVTDGIWNLTCEFLFWGKVKEERPKIMFLINLKSFFFIYYFQDMIRLQLLYNFNNFFLKLLIGCVWPTCKKMDPKFSLKKKLLKLYNNHFSFLLPIFLWRVHGFLQPSCRFVIIYIYIYIYIKHEWIND